MDKEKIRKELYEKVNEWFAEQPQRPIAQFMFETMWQYIEAAQQSVQADSLRSDPIAREWNTLEENEAWAGL